MKRGRPKKTAQVAPETTQKPAEPTAVVDTPKTVKTPPPPIQAVIDKLDELIAALAVFARLAAVDTVHTAERPETLFRRAIAEASIAANVIAQTKNGGAA